MNYQRLLLPLIFGCLCQTGLPAVENLKVLFLGDQGHHQPSALSAVLTPEMAKVGITITYTEDPNALSLDNLRQYAGLIVFANIDTIEPQQESALLEYVANGGGFVPLHCASYCFRNSPAVVDLIGAQFLRHGGEVFRTEVVAPEHPIMQGFTPFESWDETYIHTKHNERNRIVLEVRRQGGQAEGRNAEPWTWVRTHGQGRVFYTAWGHDQRTWKHPGFLNLVERGIRWACGQDPVQVADYRDPNSFAIPRMTEPRTDVADFEYEEVGPKIPNYLDSERWGTQGEVITQMQKPLSPEESLKHYVTPEDFHLELFVSEPEIQGKPIAMNWDHRGRLWLCETVDYPNELQPPEQGRDRIRICEDSDGDGRADKFTVFAEQLSIPTSIEFCHGGVIVQAGVQTLFLRDNDGDDRADERHVLISGWAMGDTHGGVSNFQYGLDNRYWAMQGYNNSRPRYAGGQHRGFRQGPFNFTVGGSSENPEVTDVEFIRSTSNNSWGLGISEEGLIFASTANRAPSFFVPIPNRYYERVRGWTPNLTAEAIAPDHYFKPITDKVRQVDHHGGYTAGAGHALYTARNYPRDWWNRTAFVCGPTGHLVGTYLLQRDGASFRDRNAFNLIASDDEWSAPIMAEVGPDGNMWIIDWYNYIVQHNPTPQGFTTGKGNAYESDLRDKTHGRIYRLVYDGDLGQAGADRPAELDPDSSESLVAGLSQPNRLWRRHAQRLLVERNQQDIVPQLLSLIGDQTVDAIDSNPGAVHALWTLHGLAALDDPGSEAFSAVAQALSHSAAGVRRNAALVLPPTTEAAQAIVAADLVHDSDRQVQLAALMALADMPISEQAGVELARLAKNKALLEERYVREALICAAATQGTAFLNAFVSMTMAEAASEQQQLIARVIGEHLARSGLENQDLLALMERMPGTDAALRQPLLEGLAAGWPVDNEKSSDLSPEVEQALLQLLASADSRELAPMLKLGTIWGSDKLRDYRDELSDELFSKIDDPDAPIRNRVSAVQELIGLLGSESEIVSDLMEIVSPQIPPALSSGIVRGLADATAPNVAEELIGGWSTLTPLLRTDALTVLMARPSTTMQMLASIDSGSRGNPDAISIDDLSLDQQQTLRTHPNSEIRRWATRLLRLGGNLVNEDRQKVIESYVEATRSTGDAARGKELFTKNCAICHKHSGEGKDIGPELTGMAVHPKSELLVHILDPSRSVEGNFRRYTVLTAAGQILTGMLAAESQAAVELIDAEGKQQTISREDIEQVKSSNKSMMPEGFEQQLKVADMTDLLEFLTSKGKFVPLPLAGVATAISTKGLFSNSDRGSDRLIFSEWGLQEFQGVPFQFSDPQGDQRANIVLLNGPRGSLPPKMPKQVSLPCNMRLETLHLLSGVSGWGYPYENEQSTSMIVRFHYEDGQTEDHPLQNGVHFADYIRRVDVPESTFAFALGSQQIRYLSVHPERRELIRSVDLIKGDDATAPIIMAVTAEQAD